MIQKTFIFTIALFISTYSFGQADTLYVQTLQKMFVITKVEDTYEAAINQMLTMMKEQAPDSDSEFFKLMEQEFTVKAMKELFHKMVPVYAKYFTQEDLEQLIAFYETPIGQKFVNTTPMVMQESMQIGQEWGMELGKKIEKMMKERE